MERAGRGGTRVIRRYGNRKLYDTQARRYVTLEELSRLVNSGHDVEVVDQATGEDLTAVVLAQVILEGVRERTARVPRQVLAGIIRLGAGTASAAAESWPAQAAMRAGQEAERIALRVMGRLTLDEAVRLRQEIAEALQRAMVDAQQGIQSRLGAFLRRTSWHEATGRRRPGKRRAPARRRAKPPRPRGRRRPPSSGTGGKQRSRPSPRRRRRSAGRSRP